MELRDHRVGFLFDHLLIPAGLSTGAMIRLSIVAGNHIRKFDSTDTAAQQAQKRLAAAGG